MPVNNTSIDFAHAARTIGREVRRRGLVAPGFAAHRGSPVSTGRCAACAAALSLPCS